ncbi:MAG: DUF3617 domain-containing protein [Thiobacillus sp.]
MNMIDDINRWPDAICRARLALFRPCRPLMRLPARLALFACASLPAAVAAATPQPGLYTVTLQLAMPGTALQLPARQHQKCFGEREIVYGTAYAVAETGSLCAITQFQQAGDTVRYNFVCETAGPSRMVGRAEGRRDANGYEIRMVGGYVPPSPGMQHFTQILRAQRIGACPTR